MANIKIELEMDDFINDNFDYEGGFDFEESIEQEIKKLKKEHIKKVFEEKYNKKIDEITEAKMQKINEKFDIILDEEYSKNLLEMKIPVKKSEWGSGVIYVSISEFLEGKFNDYLNKKQFDRDGKRTSSHNAKYTPLELMTSNFIEKTLNTKVEIMIKEARQQVERNIVESLEAKLKENLNKDIIDKMNIPNAIAKLVESQKK